MYQARNPDPGNPRRRGSAASRAALERAAAPRPKPGPSSLSLGSEKRRGNLGRNFANFALREGENSLNGPGSGGPRRASGPPARPRNPPRALGAGGGARGWPAGCVLPVPPEPGPRPRAPSSPRRGLNGLKNLALGARDLLFLYVSGIIFSYLTRAVPPSPSFVFLRPSLCLPLSICPMCGSFVFSFLHSLVPRFIFFLCTPF